MPPTLKQRAAVAELLKVENGRRPSVGEAMRRAGYSPATTVDPGKLTRTKGYREVFEEMGLTPGFLTTALVDDIKAKPRRRYHELNLGFEVLGLKKKNENDGGDQPSVVVNILSNFSGYEDHGGGGTETSKVAPRT